TVDACDPESGVTHTPVATCGPPSAPLPAPPLDIDTAPATATVAGVDFIDPDGLLDGLDLVVSPLATASSHVAGADDAWQVEPTGALAGTVYLRFPLSRPLPPGDPMLLWSRPDASAPFAIQSLARVTADGHHAVAALRHFSQQALEPLHRPTSSLLGRRRLYQSDPTQGDFIPPDADQHALELSVSPALAFAYRARRESGGDPTFVVRSPPFVRTYPATHEKRVVLSAFAGDVRATPDGDIARGALGVGVGDHPAISAFGTVVYETDDGQIALVGGGLVSATPDGDPGNGFSDGPGISASGRYVVFRSTSNDLDPESPFGGMFVRDLETGLTQRAYLPDGYDDWSQLDVAPIPNAISDGGRYFFLQGPTFAEGVDGLSCRPFYRIDRQLESADLAGEGDWLAVDRTGRVAAFHRCNFDDDSGQQSDITGPHPATRPTTFANIAVAGIVVRDVTTGAEVTTGPTLGELFADSPGTSADPTLLRSRYLTMNASAGALSLDGWILAYALNIKAYETRWRYEIQARPVPDLTPEPVLEVDAVLEGEPFEVAFSDMLAETTGDLIVLSGPDGPVATRGTDGASSGVVSFEGVEAGEYLLNVYYAMDADPPVVRFRESFPLTVSPFEPTMTLIGAPCAGGTLVVDIAGFTTEPDDELVLTRDGAVVERVLTGGRASARLTFETALDVGDYELEAWLGPTGTPVLRGTLAFTAGSCLTEIAGDGPLPPSATASPPGTVACQLTSNSTGEVFTLHHGTQLTGVSQDGRFVAYRTATGAYVEDLQAEVSGDWSLADVDGFAMSPSGASIVVAWMGSEIVRPLAQPVNWTTAGAPEGQPTALAVSDDGRVTAYSQAANGTTYVRLRHHDFANFGAIDGDFTFEGCAPSVSSDGRLLTYTRVQGLTDAGGFRAGEGLTTFICDLSDLPQSVACMPLDFGFVGSRALMAPLAALSPDGTKVVFASTEPPDASFVVNPPATPPAAGRTWLYVQHVDGSERHVVAGFDNPSPWNDRIGWRVDPITYQTVSVETGGRTLEIFPVDDDGGVVFDGRAWVGPDLTTEVAGITRWTPATGAVRLLGAAPDGLNRHHYGVSATLGARFFAFWSDLPSLPGAYPLPRAYLGAR
ncbi:MAG: PD40 domain-containing protein, partial [Myxococcales bacterium]|nr:PD40 domain-containing protein [Myxococcales bacterium]